MLLICLTAGLTFACMAGSAILLLRSPFNYQQARRRWEQYGPAHYQVDVAWASGWSYGHVRAEMLDGQIVAATDIDTGRPLGRMQLATAGFYTSIDNMFRMIGEQIRPPNVRWRQILRFHPLLARWFDRCTALLPQIEFDPALGYPASIDYYGSPCFNGSDSVMVRIERFRALP